MRSRTLGALVHTALTRSTLAVVLSGVLFAACSDSSGPKTGALDVTVTGLPAGTNGALSVTGPSGYAQALTAGQSLPSLRPGTYTIAASSVSDASGTYAPSPASQTAAVAAGSVHATASVSYALSTGGLTVTISGLPSGAVGAVTVTGPGGFSQALTATTALIKLTPGQYTVTAASVSASGGTWAATAPTQLLTVSAGATAATATVTYVIATGSLAVTVAGLPSGVNASINVTGPGGYTHAVTATTTLTNLTPGSYVVVPAAVASGGTNYGGAPATQSLAVTAGATASATVTYSVVVASTLDLRVDRVYITQSTQNYAGDVPLVAGRNGELRAFVIANQANSATPAVRVRFYSNGTLVQTSTITAPGASVPLAPNESVLNSSWNMVVPASLIQPGLTILADADPNGVIPESNKSNNSYPASGQLTLDVRTLAQFNVQFVPVFQSVPNVTGNVNSGNLSQYTTQMMKVWPISTYSATVHATYTSGAPALDANDTNGAWGQILSEILSLSLAEHATAYYFGVAHAAYGGGIAGLGYIGAPYALGWDHVPADGVVAHELGHNFGLQHAPCGGASGPDANFPYTNATIGVTGFDIVSLTLHQITDYDLMSYCNPTWVSDYNYKKVLAAHTGGWDMIGNDRSAAGDLERSLLVWGRISHGELVLEPAFTVVTRPSLPATTGPYRIDALDGAGASIFSISFAGDLVADLPSGDRHFAFAIPLSADAESRLAELRLTGPGAGTPRTLRSAAAVSGSGRAFAPMPATTATAAVAGGRVRLAWNAATHPMVMVRDAVTGEVISFARGGSMSVVHANAGGELELIFSDGVRSTTQRVTPR